MEIWDKSIYTGNGFNIPVMKDNIPYTGQLFRPDVETVINFENGFIHGKVVYAYGREEWVQHGKLHRLDGPAFICSLVRYREWYVNGIIHREDGPARVWDDGKEEWFNNGCRHRLNGPALKRPSGYQEWWVDDQEVDVVALFGYLPSEPLTEEEQVLLRLGA